MSRADGTRLAALGRSDGPTEAEKAAAFRAVMLRFEQNLDTADQALEIVGMLGVVTPDRLNAAPVPQPDNLGRRARGPAGGRQRAKAREQEAS